jgi:hypothetical protein
MLDIPQATLREKEAAADTVAPYGRALGRTEISTILKASDGGLSLVGRTIRVGGWVKTGREAGAGAWAFLELNDGSCFSNLQCVVPKEVAEGVSARGENSGETSTVGRAARVLTLVLYIRTLYYTQLFVSA